jgi:hypothetical protein
MVRREWSCRGQCYIWKQSFSHSIEELFSKNRGNSPYRRTVIKPIGGHNYIVVESISQLKICTTLKALSSSQRISVRLQPCSKSIDIPETGKIKYSHIVIQDSHPASTFQLQLLQVSIKIWIKSGPHLIRVTAKAFENAIDATKVRLCIDWLPESWTASCRQTFLSPPDVVRECVSTTTRVSDGYQNWFLNVFNKRASNVHLL